MIDLFRRLYGHSFQRRLALCLSCICVASVLLVGVCSYRLASRELRVLSSKLSERNIASAGQALDDYLLSVQDWTTQMLRIAPLRKAAGQSSSADAESLRGQIAGQIRNHVSSAFSDGVSFPLVELHLKNGLSYTYSTNYRACFSGYEDVLALLSARGLEPQSDYIRTQWAVCTLQESKSSYSRSQLFCIRFLYDSATMEKLGVLLFAIDPDELSHTFSDVADGGLILGRDGIIYSSAGQYTVGNVYQDDSRGELFKTESGTRTLSYKNRYGRTVMLSCRSVLDGGGLLVIPFNDYTGISRSEMNQYIISVCALLIASAAIALAASIKLSGSLSRSIQDLTGTMKRIDGGEIDLRCSTAGVDEIAFLSEKINNMLDSLVAAQRVRETDLRAAQNLELRLMQSQINPHLLYNTLDSILWLQQSGNAQSATELVTALSGFFKSSLSRGKPMIPLRDEIQLVQYYLQIQHLARQKNIRLENRIDEKYLSHIIIKLSIQPIVENAVVHGFDGYRDDGLITMEAGLDKDFFRLTITDNGIGLMPQELESIRQTLRCYPPPADMHFFGLYNVNWRIRRTYGERYGLEIDSAVSEYTKVTLLMPPGGI